MTMTVALWNMKRHDSLTRRAPSRAPSRAPTRRRSSGRHGYRYGRIIRFARSTTHCDFECCLQCAALVQSEASLNARESYVTALRPEQLRSTYRCTH